MRESAYIINPLWVAENNFHNEGGEGFTINKKWILRGAEKPAPSVAPVSPPTSDASMFVNDERGNPVRRVKMEARLAGDLAKLPKLTDKFGISITEKAIAFARATLASQTSREEK